MWTICFYSHNLFSLYLLCETLSLPELDWWPTSPGILLFLSPVNFNNRNVRRSMLGLLCEWWEFEFRSLCFYNKTLPHWPISPAHINISQEWWHTPSNPALRRKRQRDLWVQDQPTLHSETLSHKRKRRKKKIGFLYALKMIHLTSDKFLSL